MADVRHLALIAEGAREWNKWRQENRRAVPDLTDASLSFGERQWSSVNGGPINLRRAKLSSINLSCASLIDADLEKADLAGANLSRARLVGANFRKANLSYVRFDGADVRDANFDRAELFHADLSTAINLDINQLKYAKFDSTTGLPNIFATEEFANDAPSATPNSQMIVGASRRLRILNLTFEKNRPGVTNGNLAESARMRPVVNFSSTICSLLTVVGLVLLTVPNSYYPVPHTGSSRSPITVHTQAGKVPGETPRSSSTRNKMHELNVNQPEKRQAALYANAAWRRSRDDGAWNWAKHVGTPSALQSYLDMHLDGRHTMKAQQRLAVLEEEEEAKKAAEEARRRAVAEAARLAAEDSAWNNAKRADTKSALQSYVDTYSDGRHAKEARQRLAALETEEAASIAAEEERRRAADEAEQSIVAETVRLPADDAASPLSALRTHLDVPSQGRDSAEAQRPLAFIDPGVVPLPERKPANRQDNARRQIVGNESSKLPLPTRKPKRTVARKRPEPSFRTRYLPDTSRLGAAVNGILSGRP